MKVVTNRVRKGKPVQITLNYRFNCINDGVILRISEDNSRKVDTYGVREFHAPEGRAFELYNLDSVERYNVYVPICESPENIICDCKGFLALGRCKHTDVMVDAVRSGILDAGYDREEEGFPSDQQVEDDARLPF